MHEGTFACIFIAKQQYGMLYSIFEEQVLYFAQGVEYTLKLFFHTILIINIIMLYVKYDDFSIL